MDWRELCGSGTRVMASLEFFEVQQLYLRDSTLRQGHSYSINSTFKGKASCGPYGIPTVPRHRLGIKPGAARPFP